MNKLSLLKLLLLKEDDTVKMEKTPKKFEDDPMNYILTKYQNLDEALKDLMSDNFKDLVTGIYIVAYKPTTFKIVLHNGQYMFFTFMGKAYQATIAGKNYFLYTIAEKQKAMLAIARLLRMGSSLKIKGAEGGEQSTDETSSEAPPAETSEPAAGEEETLEESINKQIIKKLLIEAEQKKSVLFETALVLGWYKAKYGKNYENKIPPDAVKQSEVDLIKIKYPDLIDKGEKAVKTLGLTSGKSAYSAGKLTSPLTPFWSSYGAKNQTSKADVILGDARVSVKAGPSQLMSGAKEETKATFYAALKKCPELINSKEVKEILKSIEGFAKSGRTQGKIAPALKAGKDRALLAANAANKKAMSQLQNLFETNEKFAVEFAKEAMSGEMKFGKQSLAYAEYILAVDSSYDNPVLHKTTDAKYAKKVAGQMKLEVRFKTGSIKSKGSEGQYGYFTVLGLHSDPTKLEKKPVKEGIFDNIKSFFSNIWGKITSSITSLVNFFSGGSENLDVNVGGEESIDFS
jgi:hypothetical protein